MRAYLTTCTGEEWELPTLFSWQFTRTDGESCDEAQLDFPYEPERLSVLKSATRLRLVEGNETCYYGVVDEFSVLINPEGRRVRLCSRGLQALLMDNELRAAEFTRLQWQDAVAQFCVPFGVIRVEGCDLPPVERFALETGQTAWQALRGFVRHSAGYCPRFSVDGKLLLTPAAGTKRTLTPSDGVIRAEYRHCRYGVISRQIVVSAGYMDVETGENEDFLLRGGSCQKVTLRQGKTLKADWRTAIQRLRDAAAGEFTLHVTLSGDFTAQPGDRVRAELSAWGIGEEFTLESVTRSLSAQGRRTVLRLKGGKA